MKKQTIGQRIALARKDNGLTGAALSAKLGYAAGYVASIECGQKEASLTAVVGIAEILGVSLDYLVHGKKEK